MRKGMRKQRIRRRIIAVVAVFFCVSIAVGSVYAFASRGPLRLTGTISISIPEPTLEPYAQIEGLPEYDETTPEPEPTYDPDSIYPNDTEEPTDQDDLEQKDSEEPEEPIEPIVPEEPTESTDPDDINSTDTSDYQNEEY